MVAVGVAIGRWPFVDTYLAGDTPFGDLGVLLNMSTFYIQNPDGDPYSDDWGFGPNPNYPTLLPRLLALLGITEEHRLIIGVALAVLASLALTLVWALALRQVKREDLFSSSVFALLTVFSPPVILLIERGNYDSLIFVLIGIVVTVQSRWVHVAVVSAASLAKIFPVAAVAGLIRTKGNVLSAIIPVVLLGVYLLLMPQDFMSVDRNTPRPSWNGYGALVFMTYFEEFFPGLGYVPAFIFNLFVHVVALGIFLYLVRPQKEDILKISTNISNSAFLERLLLIGFPVFALTYLFGNSFDYRLVFLVLPMMALVSGGLLSTRSGVGWAMISLLVFYWNIPGFQISPLGDFMLILLLLLIFQIWRPVLLQKLDWQGLPKVPWFPKPKLTGM